MSPSYLLNSHRLKGLSVIVFALFASYTLWSRVLPAFDYLLRPRSHPALITDIGANQYENITAHLVVASTLKEDTAWTANLQIPHLKILRYIADSAAAEYRPAAFNKGREALMYFTYLHDFYDDLPDVSIFVHADETPWHVEGTLLRNTSFALSRLDLQQVIKRQYFNLRVTWRASCPAWINTSNDFSNFKKPEEPYMKEAWRANFGEDDEVPEILAGPCCSQFAVSREAIRSRPKEQYARSVKWLTETKFSDHIAGRVWEHMWPYLFKKEAKDCAPEISSLCELYGICFKNVKEINEYKELWEEVERLKEAMQFHRAVWNPRKAAEARRKMDQVGDEIEHKMIEVLQRHQSPSTVKLLARQIR
ncbi:hypothetical protein CBER1_08235 [Cercospora berteroae]|uniref:Uncharacterized protein n=1 Tax=Cercospora berteroae TaxID=357750 RepID=A0A2S6CGD5_9PEZI|nr:hypothetical protein CBER1_08235 [Cercospora berteroae]